MKSFTNHYATILSVLFAITFFTFSQEQDSTSIPDSLLPGKRMPDSIVIVNPPVVDNIEPPLLVMGTVSSVDTVAKTLTIMWADSGQTVGIDSLSEVYGQGMQQGLSDITEGTKVIVHCRMVDDKKVAVLVQLK